MDEVHGNLPDWGGMCVCVQHILTVAPQGETGIIAGLVGIVNTY